MSDKKKQQLGMNPSTAANRLVKDILWKLIQDSGKDLCCKCGANMSRETFSIEHVVPWLDSEDPVGLYFDLDNISFSHLKCNVADGRKPVKKYHTPAERNAAKRPYDKLRTYCPIKRRERYERKGH
jgi:hypothetical protein